MLNIIIRSNHLICFHVYASSGMSHQWSNANSHANSHNLYCNMYIIRAIRCRRYTYVVFFCARCVCAYYIKYIIYRVIVLLPLTANDTDNCLCVGVCENTADFIIIFIIITVVVVVQWENCSALLPPIYLIAMACGTQS